MNVAATERPGGTVSYLESTLKGRPVVAPMAKSVLGFFVAFEFFLSSPIGVLKLLPAQVRQNRDVVVNFLAQLAQVMQRKMELLRDNSQISEHTKTDFLTALLQSIDSETGVKISHDEGMNCLKELVLGGTDTSANSLSFIVYELARHPEVVRKLREELDAAAAGTPDGRLDFDKISNLAYLDAVIKEVTMIILCFVAKEKIKAGFLIVIFGLFCAYQGLRLHPVVPIVFRLAREDLTIAGYHLKSGTGIVYDLYSNQTDPALFPSPLSFLPERFLNLSGTSDGPEGLGYAYIPFGYGVRKCPGQLLAMLQMKIVLSRLVQGYDFRLAGGATLKKSFFVVNQCHDLPVYFDKRK
jgi:cytochrome P450